MTEKSKPLTFSRLISIIVLFFGLLFFVSPVRAQTDAGLCADFVSQGEAATMSCLNEHYGASNISNFCDPAVCQCDNWAAAVTFESVNTTQDCEYYQCGLYADSGSSRFAACFPLLSDVAEEVGEPCSIRIDTSNPRLIAINSLDITPGNYYVRSYGIKPNGSTDILRTQSVSLGGAGTVATATTPTIPERYNRARFAVISTSGEEQCQTAIDASMIQHLETEVTDEEIIAAADPDVEEFDYCMQVPVANGQRRQCNECVTQGDPGEYIFTAVGCIHVADDGNFLSLAEDLIRLLLGVAGGAAFLSILAAAFILTTSRGETSKVKQAKELITAAVSGLLFIIFSIIILDYIGVTILHIPGLS